MRNAVVIAATVLFAGCAESEPAPPLFERLLAGDADRNAALTQVLESPHSVNSFALLLAADHARKTGALADAAFLLNAGRIRAAADKEAFPERDGGDVRPSLMLNTLEHTASENIGLEIASDREAYSRVIGRLHDWRPQVGRGYDPGWLHDDPLGREEVESLLAVTKQARLDEMRALARLLQDDEYYGLVKEVRRLKDGSALGPDIDRQRLERIVRRGREIERAKNIDGAFSALE